MNSQEDPNLLKLRQAKKKLNELTEVISAKSKELTQLRKDKKVTEQLIEALEDSLGTHSFVEAQAFSWTKEVKDRLNNVFRIQSFRGLQENVINATLSNKDCIYVAATGSGKSLVFQLPALISSGITLVVSPLLSLMEDQVNQLDELGIPAIVLNSTTSKEDFKRASNAMVDPNASIKLIYVTPEKLAKSKFFMSQIEKMYEKGRFSRLVIDEVHCCSEWGHDFRKDYNQLHVFKREYPETPILGLTATATSQVILDIKKMLNIPKCLVYKGTFYRPNLIYEIKPTTTKEIISDLADLITGKFHNLSGIIYCLTIKDTEDVAEKLGKLGINCEAYHAQLHNDTRSKIQQRWYTNRCKVIAATVAFGLGINKMDVRFVIHYTISKSLENYYQETGRAGRDGKEAHCICYYRFSDVFRATSLTFRERNGKERVYQMLAYCLNRNDCRKSLLAEYFEDKLIKDKNDVDCCDNCRQNRNCPAGLGTSDKYIDGGEWLDSLLEILDQASRQNEKMTSNKLIEAWMQIKGNKKLRLETPKPQLDRTDCETVIGLLLCDGYLQESFHMTPYSTISYIVPGSRNSFSRGNNRPQIPRAALQAYRYATPRRPTSSSTGDTIGAATTSTNRTTTTTTTGNGALNGSYVDDTDCVMQIDEQPASSVKKEQLNVVGKKNDQNNGNNSSVKQERKPQALHNMSQISQDDENEVICLVSDDDSSDWS